MPPWTKTPLPNECGRIRVKPIGDPLEVLRKMGITAVHVDHDPPSHAWNELNILMSFVEDKGKHVKSQWRDETADFHIKHALDHINKWQNRERLDRDDGNHHLINAFARIGFAAELDSQPQAEEP